MKPARDERGSVLVTAVMLMSIMIGVALAAYALVDTETRAAGRERTGETSFNFTEQLLSAQVYKLSRDWPGRGASTLKGLKKQPYPMQCSNAAATDPRCPDAAAILARFGGADLAAGATWSTTVRDNRKPNPNYYNDAETLNAPCTPPHTETPCRFDANGDGQLWVRAQASVRGKRRTLVALVRVDETVEQFPNSVIIAGKFKTTNAGRKVIVGTGNAPLQVRCLTRTPDCLDYEPNKGQVSPDTTSTGYTGGDAMTDEQIARVRERALAEGSYFSTCPARPEDLDSHLVFIESGNCAYGNEVAPCCYSQSAPGILLLHRGTIELSGNIVFHGLVYAANRDNNTGWVVSDTGTASIRGGVAIDRQGGMLIGSSDNNLTFDFNVFNKMTSYPSAGIVQNTWREIPA